MAAWLADRTARLRTSAWQDSYASRYSRLSSLAEPKLAKRAKAVGATRACNQTVMSGKIKSAFVDFSCVFVRGRSRSSRFVHAVSGAKLVRCACG